MAKHIFNGQVYGETNDEWIGTQAEYEIAKDTIPDGYKVIITDDNDDSVIRSTTERTVICIGDSYNLDDTGWWTGWGTCLANLCPSWTVYSYAAGGGGFVANTHMYNFLGALQAHSQDAYEKLPVENPKEVTDVVVLGCYNDMSVNATELQLTNKISEFIQYCNKEYPYAKITIGCIAVDYNSPTNQGKLNALHMTIENIAAKLGATTNYGFKFILLDKSRLLWLDGNANSGFHPCTAGNKEVANCLSKQLTGSTFKVRNGEVWNGGYIYQDEGNITIMNTPQEVTGRSDFLNKSLNGKTLTFNTWVDLGATANLLWGATSANTATWVLELWHGGGSQVEFITDVVFKIENKHVYAKNAGNTNNIVIDSNHYLKLLSPLHFDWQEMY